MWVLTLRQPTTHASPSPTSPFLSRPDTSGALSSPWHQAMEPALGQLRSTRLPIRLYRPRPLTARHLATHRGDPRAGTRRQPRRSKKKSPCRLVTTTREVGV